MSDSDHRSKIERRMDADIHVLHVDDTAALRDITAELLERVNDRITVRSEADPSTALRRVEDGTVDCVVSDYRMPAMDGLELCRRVRRTHPDLPYFLFTNEYGEAIVDEAMCAGVTDFIQKDSGTTQYKLLANRIENAVRHYRTRERIDEVEEAG